MKICSISDTHQQHHKMSIPDADLLIHAGDFTNQGRTTEIESFMEWFVNQPHSYKVFICGNHERGTGIGHAARPQKIGIINRWLSKTTNCFYLENSSVTINGFKIYGSPITPRFYDWEWNVDRGPAIRKFWDDIPDDVDILVTHGMPYGILDRVTKFSGPENAGCVDLKNRIDELKHLKTYIGGHLHQMGSQVIQKNGTIFINASSCNEMYQPVNYPIVVEI